MCGSCEKNEPAFKCPECEEQFCPECLKALAAKAAEEQEAGRLQQALENSEDGVFLTDSGQRVCATCYVALSPA